MLQYEEKGDTYCGRAVVEASGAGPVADGILGPALAEVSTEGDHVEGSWEIIPKGLSSRPQGETGLPAL